jgi:F420-dependent oxidoreductase-like protein
MRIGVQTGVAEGTEGALEALVEKARALEAQGFATVSVPNIFGLDAIGAMTVVGRHTRTIELATGVVPTFPRHPVAMAQQALTAQAASHGRFLLGIGLSHQVVIEGMLGLSYAHPARHMREYLEVLGPLLRQEPVKHAGELYRVNAQLRVPGTARVPLLVAALGPAMLALAGRLADGTVTWMTGPETLRTHVVPRIRKAAEEAGRPAPRIVAGFPVAVTKQPAAARERIAKQLQIYGMLPSYRAMLDREGAGGPADVAIVGDAAEIRAALTRLRDAGVTDFQAVAMEVDPGAEARTLETLAALRL